MEDNKLSMEGLQPYFKGKTTSLRLMNSRLGNLEYPYYKPDTVEGALDMAMHLKVQGGFAQQDRMIRDKRRSLDKAVLYSYQGAWVKKFKYDFEPIMDDLKEAKPVRALINSNKLKEDFDEKIISIGFEHDIQVGDVFEWCNTKSHWLVYLQDLTELAYFRGDIRKCSYEIAWQDEQGEQHKTYAAVRGPVETKINFIQKHGISVDTPNHSLNILMPKTDAALEYFKRYKKFYLKDDPTCWRVEATDWISMPGILEVVAVEYYANEDEDDIETGIVGGLIEEVENPNGESRERIVGETFIKVKKTYEYKFDGTLKADWNIDKKYPVQYTVDSKDPRKIYLMWDTSYSGQFELCYGKYSKTIVVESLF